MFPVFVKSLKARWVSLLLVTIIAIAFLLMFAGMYPEIQAQAETLKLAIAAYPESLMKAFGVDGTAMFDSFENFISLEYYSAMWPILLLIIAQPAGLAISSKEVDSKTMGNLLALPLARWQIFLSKYLAGVFQVILFTGVSVLAIIPVAQMFNFEISTESHLVVMLLGLLFGLAMLSLSSLVSVLFDNHAMASGGMTGMIIIMYALKIFSSLQDSFSGLKWFSFFHYFDYQLAFSDSRISWQSLLVFGTVTVTSFILGMYIFQKRDYSV